MGYYKRDKQVKKNNNSLRHFIEHLEYNKNSPTCKQDHCTHRPPWSKEALQHDPYDYYKLTIRTHTISFIEIKETTLRRGLEMNEYKWVMMTQEMVLSKSPELERIEKSGYRLWSSQPMCIPQSNIIFLPLIVTTTQLFPISCPAPENTRMEDSVDTLITQSWNFEEEKKRKCCYRVRGNRSPFQMLQTEK